MKKVFIDGSSGTTGLRIRERLEQRKDIELLSAATEFRHDAEYRKALMNQADIVFLCLPDAAAIEAAELPENPETVILDTSTAHRTASDWVYGFPELSGEYKAKICSAKRIAVPGCHASGFIALIYPLLREKALSPEVLLSCHSLTGFSGGGKSMIADYSSAARSKLLDAPRQYGLTQQHKHLKEMKAITGLAAAPIFSPIVADYFSGMEVSVPLFANQLNRGFGVEDIKKIYQEYYSGVIVRYVENMGEDGFLSANRLSGKDSMELSVLGNADRILLTAVYDNLGKGASGAAIECMNLTLGLKEEYGLSV